MAVRGGDHDHNSVNDGATATARRACRETVERAAHTRSNGPAMLTLAHYQPGPFLKMIKQIIKVWMVIRISWTYFYPVAHHLCKSSLPLSGPIQP